VRSPVVAITPACAYIAPYAAVILGLIAGIVCALAVGLKYKLGFDDSLDVVGVHFFGGWIGCLFIGFFATVQADGGAYVKHEGLFYGGGGTQLLAQFEGAGIVTIWSFVVALVIGLLLKSTGLLRLKRDSEVEGIDVAEHKESAYDFTGGGGGSGAPSAFAQAGIGSPSAGAHADEPAAAPANA